MNFPSSSPPPGRPGGPHYPVGAEPHYPSPSELRISRSREMRNRNLELERRNKEIKEKHKEYRRSAQVY